MSSVHKVKLNYDIVESLSAIVAFGGEGSTTFKNIRKYQTPCKFSVDVVVGNSDQSSYFRTYWDC